MQLVICLIFLEFTGSYDLLQFYVGAGSMSVKQYHQWSHILVLQKVYQSSATVLNVCDGKYCLNHIKFTHRVTYRFILYHFVAFHLPICELLVKRFLRGYRL